MRTSLVEVASIDEPITIPEARVHLNNPENMENSEILFFIQTAKEQTEHKLGRKIMAQTWEGYLDGFPVNEIELPYPPLSAVTSVKYYDVENVLQTVDPTTYVVDTSGETGRITLGFNKTWPTVAAVANAVVIRFVSGYSDADAIPQSIKHYMKLMISEFRANKELTTEREVFLTPWAERLLDPYTVRWVV